jgi:hypothetical protein
MQSRLVSKLRQEQEHVSKLSSSGGDWWLRSAVTTALKMRDLFVEYAFSCSGSIHQIAYARRYQYHLPDDAVVQARVFYQARAAGTVSQCFGF